MASYLHTAGPVCSADNDVTHGFYSGSYFEHQSWANNVQRLLRIHSHIRGLFWTSKLLCWRRVAGRHWLPFITQLPVCTCHLECVYVWVYIIVIQYQLHHANVIMSKKRNLSHVGTQSCLDKRSGISQLVSCPVGRTHRSIDQQLANVNVPIRTVAPPSDHGKSYNFP